MKIRSILNTVMLVTVMLGINTSAAASLITGEMGMTGNYGASGGTDLSDATDISLNALFGTSGTGDIGATVSFGTPGTGNGSFSIASFTPAINVLTIGGWQLDLTTLNIIDQEENLLTMDGTGVLSGNGFYNTVAEWSFSAQNASSYSMSVAVVPVPAAVWLFASGLIGLIGVARRKDQV